MNLQTEIGKIIFGIQDKSKGFRTYDEAEARIVELFDKSVERVIGGGEPIGFSYKEDSLRPITRNKLRKEQRQTWNKIKGGLYE
jgi:hypothetical protein